MQSIQVGEFKRDFSKLLDLVQNQGEKFVIEYGRSHKKVAMLVPYSEGKSPKRVFGPYQGKGSFKMHTDFNMTEEELIES